MADLPITDMYRGSVAGEALQIVLLKMQVRYALVWGLGRAPVNPFACFAWHRAAAPRLRVWPMLFHSLYGCHDTPSICGSPS